MQRTSFWVTMVLLLGCCLGLVLLVSSQAIAGAVFVRDEFSNGGIGSTFCCGVSGVQKGYTALSLDVAEISEARTELPSVSVTGVSDATIEGLEGLEVGYVDDTRVQILTDLHDIYTCPIQVNENDLYLLMVSGGALLLIDQDVYDRINAGPRTPESGHISTFITELGNSLSALTICGLISRKDPETAYLGANAVAYSGIACLTLKAAFGRARPWLGEGPYAFNGLQISDRYNSMPSGHSATAFALATVLARQYPEYKRIFYACASLIALSRVYVHAHWPSDVLVGAALGVWSANQVMGSSRILEIRW